MQQKCPSYLSTERRSTPTHPSSLYITSLVIATYNAKFPAVQGTLSGSDGHVYPAPVGSFKLNAFGLCDMLGNVTQLCSDWFSPNPYSGPMPLEDPTGPFSGDRHVLRGVGFNNTADQGSLAARWRFWPNLAMTAAGFRICRELGEGSPPPNHSASGSCQSAGGTLLDECREGVARCSSRAANSSRRP